jgi:hypothetical protein
MPRGGNHGGDEIAEALLRGEREVVQRFNVDAETMLRS